MSSTTAKNITQQLRRPTVWWLLLWLLLILASTWLVHLLQQVQRQNQHVQDALQQTRFDADRQIRPLQQQVLQQQQQLNNLQQELQQLHQSPKLLQQKHQLQTAQYLVEQAQLSLNFARDSEGALLLLQTADARIRQLNDLHYLNLRQQLAQVIVNLQAIPTVDVAGVLAQLQALIRQTDTLPLLAANPLPEAKAIAAAENSTKFSHWRHIWQATWQQLQQVIIIRHHNNSIVPLLEPQQEAYLRHNLQLLLQQAQWAVLHSDVKLYQTSLSELQDALQQHFSNNSGGAKGISTVIEQLQQVSLKPRLPDLAPLAAAINETLLNLNNKIMAHSISDANTAKAPLDDATDNASATSLKLPAKPMLFNGLHSATLEAETL